MKLTYWIAECLNDSTAYSVRRRTKREVVAQIASDPENYAKGFGPVHKVTVEYEDGFDLLDQCLGEGGIYEGDRMKEEA